MSLTTILLATLVAIVFYFVYSLRKRFSYWQQRGIACEEPDSFYGSMKGLNQTRSFRDITHEYYEKFKGSGPFAGFYWGYRPAVFVLDPSLIKNILIKDFHKFSDRGFYHNEKDDPLTGQLFLIDGAKWKVMRNKLSPTFTSGKMKFMFPIIRDICEQFIEVLDGMSSEYPEVEVKDILARFTTDVIGSCAFGIDCCSLKNPNAEFRLMGKKGMSEQRHSLLVMAFMQSFPEVAAKLGLKLFTQDVIDFFMRIVRETAEYREQNNVRRNDFMDMLIDLKNKKLIPAEHGEDLKNLTMEEITGQAFVFFNAGFDTSSTTMCFALYELARHQEIQEKARQEVRKVFEKHNNEFHYESMREMSYLEQVISETLRLYTVAPLLNRLALEDYEVPGNPKYVIKKGMPVLIPISAIHHDPEYFPNPKEFNPENFSSQAVAERDSILYIPFGEGPRNCIGMRFGKMQATIGLAYLLKYFRFEICERTQIPLQFDKKNMLVTPERGVVLKVTKI
ncbi:probable cytochrome P450 6a21 [Musca vetustissima]|uniref:probable cytochrome P450 6a21 n=1 Tax=Musca vetustissima TaxID=27455 RepID=UPI002AB782B2|nr:probable cytochrome P450 6a21 [Musca vetustissima]